MLHRKTRLAVAASAIGLFVITAPVTSLAAGGPEELSQSGPMWTTRDVAMTSTGRYWGYGCYTDDGYGRYVSCSGGGAGGAN
jgi:hypothetical protein